MRFGVLVAVCVGVGVCCSWAEARAQSTAGLTPAQIDHLIRVEWKKQGVLPAPPVDDARYLRRISLDIIGTIPPPDAVRAFLADRSPDKRQRAVQALLDSPQYATNWTNYWDSVLMGRNLRMRQVDDRAFRDWLHTQFAHNTHWNRLVYDLLTATGANSAQGYAVKNMPNVQAAARQRAALNNLSGNRRDPAMRSAGDMKSANDAMMQAVPSNPGDPNRMMTGGSAARTTAYDPPVNGATNWTLKYVGNPQDLSGQASKIFLGVQIQCAQCHDHKTEKWKQQDFRRFTACFITARPRNLDYATESGGTMRRFNLVDVPRPFVPLRALKASDYALYAAATPAALDGTDFSDSRNRRQALAAWMTAPQNPWFAEAIVNRLWSHFLGRGFIEPIDDIRPSNPTILPDLLKQLSDDFVAHDYDLKHLIATICATQVYQLMATPAKRGEEGNTLWERFRLKPMTPDQLLDSLVEATNMQPVLERVAGARLDQIKLAMQRQFTFLFDVDEEFEQKDFEGTIPQALMLLNGNLVNRGATPIPGTALADVLSMQADDRAKIEALYLRTLSRLPTPTELNRWIEFVHAPRTLVTGNDIRLPQSGPVATAAGAATNRNLRQALRRRAGNNGFDPLARLGAGVRLAQQSPEEQAYEDLFWALLNSSEFTFNH